MASFSHIIYERNFPTFLLLRKLTQLIDLHDHRKISTSQEVIVTIHSARTEHDSCSQLAPTYASAYQTRHRVGESHEKIKNGLVEFQPRSSLELTTIACKLLNNPHANLHRLAAFYLPYLYKRSLGSLQTRLNFATRRVKNIV